MRNYTVVTEFILLGLSHDPQLQVVVFVFLLITYILSITGNLTIITLTLSIFLGHEPVGKDNIDAFLHCTQVDMVLFGILSLLAVGCTLARNSSGAKAA